MMKRLPAVLLLLAAVALGACAAPPAPAPPTATIIAAPEAAGQVVSFTAADGVTLGGTLYGAGQTGVVFAHMFPTDQTGWTAMAQTLAGRGYLTLTFDFRGYGASGGQKEIGRIDRDLLAAAAFIRQQGATDVVLVGASMGGTAVAKVAALKPPAAAVIISAPRSFRGLAVSDEELAVAGVPRLFIGSRGDGATRDTLDMFNAAPGPKESHVYPGNAHGTFIFNSEHGADLSARLIRFIEANAPAR